MKQVNLMICENINHSPLARKDILLSYIFVRPGRLSFDWWLGPIALHIRIFFSNFYSPFNRYRIWPALLFWANKNIIARQLCFYYFPRIASMLGKISKYLQSMKNIIFYIENKRKMIIVQQNAAPRHNLRVTSFRRQLEISVLRNFVFN